MHKYAYYARCVFKTIKAKLVKSRQNQKVKSHSSLENVFAIDPANIWTRLDKMQVKNPALNDGTQGCNKGQKSGGAGSNAVRRRCPSAPSDLPKSGRGRGPPGPPACCMPALVFTLILFYKQHMIKKTSWTFLDFIQSLLIFVA